MLGVAKPPPPSVFVWITTCLWHAAQIIIQVDLQVDHVLVPYQSVLAHLYSNLDLVILKHPCFVFSVE